MYWWNCLKCCGNVQKFKHIKFMNCSNLVLTDHDITTRSTLRQHFRWAIIQELYESTFLQRLFLCFVEERNIMAQIPATMGDHIEVVCPLKSKADPWRLGSGIYSRVNLGENEWAWTAVDFNPKAKTKNKKKKQKKKIELAVHFLFCLVGLRVIW